MVLPPIGVRPIGERNGSGDRGGLTFGNATTNPIVNSVFFALPALPTPDFDAIIQPPRIDTHDSLRSGVSKCILRQETHMRARVVFNTTRALLWPTPQPRRGYTAPLDPRTQRRRDLATTMREDVPRKRRHVAASHRVHDRTTRTVKDRRPNGRRNTSEDELHALRIARRYIAVKGNAQARPVLKVLLDELRQYRVQALGIGAPQLLLIARRLEVETVRQPAHRPPIARRERLPVSRQRYPAWRRIRHRRPDFLHQP